VGRGDWWPSEDQLQLGKHAIARVMGATYFLLGPVWHLYPSLDPGRVSDPLGLNDQQLTLRDTPEDLASLLHELEVALDRIVPVLMEAFPSAREEFGRNSADVVAAVRSAEEVLRVTELG
jgi:hypothetical protein